MHFIQLAKLRIIFRITKNFFGYWLLVTGYWLRVSGEWLRVTGASQLCRNHHSPLGNKWVTGYGSLAIVPQPSLKSMFDV